MRRALIVGALAAVLVRCTTETGGTGVGLPIGPTATTAHPQPATELLPTAKDWGHPGARSEVPGENGTAYLTFCLDRLAGKRPHSTPVPARTDVASRGWVADSVNYLYAFVYVFGDPAVAEAFSRQVQGQADGCPAETTDTANATGQTRTYRVENAFSDYQRGDLTGSRDQLTVTRIVPAPQAVRTTYQVVVHHGAVVVFLDSNTTAGIDRALDAIGRQMK